MSFLRAAGDQTEQEEEETQPLRDPQKERRSMGDVVQKQRKSTKNTQPVEETSGEYARKEAKPKEVEGGWNTYKVSDIAGVLCFITLTKLPFLLGDRNDSKELPHKLCTICIVLGC
jgi:hypothetical protein